MRYIGIDVSRGFGAIVGDTCNMSILGCCFLAQCDELRMLSLCNDGTVTMPHNTAVNLDAFWPCGVTAPACSSDRQPNIWTMPADDSSNRRADFGPMTLAI